MIETILNDSFSIFKAFYNPKFFVFPPVLNVKNSAQLLVKLMSKPSIFDFLILLKIKQWRILRINLEI